MGAIATLNLKGGGLSGTIGDAQGDVISSGGRHIDGVFHPLGRPEKTNIIAVGLRIGAGFDVHAAVPIGPTLVPSRVVTCRQQHIFPTGIRIGMAVHTLVVVSSVDHCAGNCRSGAIRCGGAIAGLSENCTNNLGLGLGIGEANTFRQLSQRGAGGVGAQI